MTLEEEERIWFENTRDVNAPWSESDNDDNDDDDNDATEAVTIPEIAASGTSGIICAKKKAIAAAGAAKARREKQQRKKDAAKFVPVKITMNTNRENAAAAAEVLYVGRAQVNLPKNRNLNQVVARTQDEARKMKKRDAAKWKRLSGDLKQTAARGTKVAMLPDPKPRYCYDSDN
jgi:ribosomal protein L19E